MKKALALVVVFALALAMAIPAFAATKTVFTLASSIEDGKEGKELWLTINISDDSDLLSGTLTLTYDTTKMTFSKVAKTEDFSDGFTTAINTEEPGVVSNAFASSEPVEGTGVLFTYKFAVNADAAGDAAFKLTATELIASDTTTELEGMGAEYTYTHKFAAAATPTPTNDGKTTPAPTNGDTTPAPTGDVKPPKTGAITLIGVGVAAIVAGLGLAIRKND